MIKSLTVVLVLALMFATSGLAAPEKTAPEDPKVAKETLQRLLEIWRRYEMPFPPKDAPLVDYPAGFWAGERKGQQRAIGFLLRESDGKKAGALVQTGAHYKALDPVIPAKDAVRPLTSEEGIKLAGQLLAGWENNYFGAAVQCLDRGMEELALALYARAREFSGGEPHSAMGSRPHEDPEQVLIKYIWIYAQAQAVHPTAERRPVAALMRKLLNDGHDLRDNVGTWMCERLEAALVPGQGQPGTPLGLIDQLVDSTQNGGDTIFCAEAPAKDPFHQIRLLGFAAVPDLIEHLDDQRLTRSMTVGFNNFVSWPRRVGDLVSDLLQGLAGEELGKHWLDRQKGGTVSKEAALKWWQEVQPLGEEAFVMKGVYPHAPKDGEAHRSSPSFNSTHLDIIARRYSARLPEVYRRMLQEFPDVRSSTVSDYLSKAEGIPVEEKVALLKEGLVHANWETRLSSLSDLSELEPALYLQTLKDWLTTWPADTTGEYWTCWEANISYKVLGSSDPEVWELFLKAVKRAKIGLRMELLNPFDYTIYEDSPLKPRLTVLLAFFDDETLRVAKGQKYRGPHAGFHHDSLRMCDFVARQTMFLLDLNPEDWPRVEWTRTKRKELRRLVEARLKQP